MKRSNAGLSLIEVMVVVLLVTGGSTVALVQLKSSISVIDADKASNLVMSQLRYAREVAVDQRRNVLIEFIGTNEIKVTRLDAGGVATVLVDVFLPSGYTYTLPTGPGDTPEGYGNATAVTFSGETSGTFQGDGTMVSAAGIVVNGTVFTRGSNNGSSRALTLSGASGRVKQYYLQGNLWVIRG